MIKKLVPKEVKTEKDLLSLPRDNWHYNGYWFLVDVDTVTIAKQKRGEKAEGIVTISKKCFEGFIRAYETGKK